MRSSRLPAFLAFIILMIFSICAASIFSQTTSDECPLKIDISSTGENCKIVKENWGGFLKNDCCGLPFHGYLRALAQRANQTGELYLDSLEQDSCLSSMRSPDVDIFTCGIGRLTSGAGGCSDYSVTDVVNKLGNSLKNLSDGCRLLDSDAAGCKQCLRTWEEMDFDSDMCRFAVLISLSSQRISDEHLINALYTCLGQKSSPIVSVAGGEGSGAGRGIGYNTGLWILVGGLMGIIVVISVALWILYQKRAERKPLQTRTVSMYSFSEESSSLSISLKEIYSATNNLSASHFIGQGIAGRVYKGVLSDGQHVAIKHIIKDGQMETFVREVTSLSHIRHPNLVALLGHYDGQDECFLVYELCHNGNLSEWLFDKNMVLSWTQRLEIAVDCARGLLYLHTFPEGCIVHRDIKPTNILISANFQGKLSDFGLSKVIDLGNSYASSEVRGTFGYVDPEYQKNRRVNSSGDVYSFGIVLLQLLSGQRVINIDVNRPVPLNKMAKNLTKGGNIKEFADPKLCGEYPEGAFELVFKLALSCTGLKLHRPSIDKVVTALENALDFSTRDKSLDPYFLPSVN